MPSSSPNHLDLSDPTTIYHPSQNSRTDTRIPRHVALAEQFPEQFFDKNVTAAVKSTSTCPNDTKQTTSTTVPTKTSISEATTTTDKPRTSSSSTSTSSSEIDVFENLVHGYLSRPCDKSATTTTTPDSTSMIAEKEIKPTFHEKRRTSISSTATTATYSSDVSSTASTLALPFKQKTLCNSATTVPTMDSRKSSEIDVFDYQVAGLMSMSMDHVDQPCNNKNRLRKSSAAASVASSSSSARAGPSSSSSLWKKAKGKLTGKGNADAGSDDGSETEKENEIKEREKKEQRKRDYKILELEQKTKFGIKGGMKMVG